MAKKNPLWNELNYLWKDFYKAKQRKNLENITNLAIEILIVQHQLIRAKDPYIKNIAIFPELVSWAKIQS